MNIEQKHELRTLNAQIKACDTNTPQHDKLVAEYVALFLIATGVAQKKHVLHGETAERKLRKCGKIGKMIIDGQNDIEYNPYVPNVYNYLFTELNLKYNVKLLDENYAWYLNDKIYQIKQEMIVAKMQNDETYDTKTARNQLDKLQREFNRFYMNLRNKVIEEHRTQEIPF
ncbi:MAG: hypothetical protein MJ165_03415 [Alphaproteobacteria bacterium]|nr:hypothetical protein [Alphaproteobacteria bacterium]